MKKMLPKPNTVMRRLIIYSLYYSIFSISCFSQLSVNAGSDRVVCVNLWDMDTIQIGGNPTAFGGDGNYEYIWETEYKISPSSSYTFRASNFLNDTSLANPRIIECPTGSELIFRLTVKDNSGHISRDSVKVIFSKKTYEITGPFSHIYTTDSVLLDAGSLIGSTLPLDSLAWFPTEGLSSPYTATTWAKPTSPMVYNVYVQDTAGCYGTSTGGWSVDLLSALEGIKTVDEPYVFYNSKQLGLQVSNELVNDGYRIDLYDISGRKIDSKNLTSSFIPFCTEKSLVIFVIVNSKETIVSSGKVLIKS